ncbi:ficolin-1-like [Ptychodera flava]|uniref:ficolin-1-like n=1 Tax=Ptychodera flava TaxID=63121 RepID=UPI00396A8889
MRAMLQMELPFLISVAVLCWSSIKYSCALSDEVKYKYMDRDTTVKDINKRVSQTDVKFWSGKRDCQDVYDAGFRQSGVYEIQPRYVKRPYLAYCDMDVDAGYGWTVFQRRTDGSQNFERVWDDYKEGFGNILNEVWLGNEALFYITSSNDRNYELLVQLSDWEGNDFDALYGSFRIRHERYRYKLKLGKFLGGSANDSFSFHDNGYFSTLDRDHDDFDDKNCADRYKGGWWFKGCLESNLNGQYYHTSNSASGRGVYWYWLGSRYNYSYKYASMKIRPVKASKRKRKGRHAKTKKSG